MKFSKIFNFFLLVDHLLLRILLLLLSRTNVISARHDHDIHGEERNTLSITLKSTLNNNSIVVEDDSSPPPSSDSSFSSLTLVFLIVGVVAFVVLLFFFITYYKKYTNLKKQLMFKKNNNNNNVFSTDNHDHYQGALIKDVEKNTEIVVVKDHHHQEEGQTGEDTRGDLVFMNGRAETGTMSTENDHFELDDLLKASAEGLGKGNFGNCYRAMMERGPIVVVKRLRDLKPLSKEEFVQILREIAELRHPNLLPLLGYYYSKDEKLLLYKFASHGNAHNRLHDGRGKPTRVPFRWTSRLAVARGVAGALEYLHAKSPNIIPHGNLKLSNVLLDENDRVLVTDYGLTSLVASSLASQRMAAFKSPEFQTYKRVSRKSDVRSYGCLLLELLTGKTSADSAPQGPTNNNSNGNGNVVDICSWVHRAVREEWTAEIFDVEIASQRGANAGMLKLLQIAIRCCERSPEMRPEMSEVAREVGKIEIVGVDSEDEEFSSVDRSVTDDSLSASTPSRSIG